MIKKDTFEKAVICMVCSSPIVAESKECACRKRQVRREMKNISQLFIPAVEDCDRAIS